MLLGKSEITGLNPSLAFEFQRNILSLPRLLVKIHYGGDPLWPKGSVLEFWKPVSGGPCHSIHLTILRRFSWPSLAYMYTKVAQTPIHSFITCDYFCEICKKNTFQIFIFSPVHLVTIYHILTFSVWTEFMRQNLTSPVVKSIPAVKEWNVSADP